MSTFSNSQFERDEPVLPSKREKMNGRIIAVLALLLLTFAAEFSLVGFDDWFIVGLNMIELTSPHSSTMPNEIMLIVDVSVSLDSVTVLLKSGGWKIPEVIELIIEIIKQIFSLLF